MFQNKSLKILLFDIIGESFARKWKLSKVVVTFQYGGFFFSYDKPMLRGRNLLRKGQVTLIKNAEH